MNNWQMSYNGLTFGAGTAYGIDNITGLHGNPEIRVAMTNKPRANGQFVNPMYLGGRNVQVSLRVVSAHPSETVYDAFSAAFVVGQETELPLNIQIPGFAGGNEVLLYSRVLRFSIPTNWSYYFGNGDANIEFVASDPRFFSASETTVVASQASTGGGFTFPLTFPLSFGGSAAGGLMAISNGGEIATPWRATITGPVTDPKIENVGTGKYLRLDGTVPSGSTLVIDTRDKTVILDGNASRLSWITPQSEWHDIPVGNSQFRFSGTSGSGSCSISYRSAWI